MERERSTRPLCDWLRNVGARSSRFLARDRNHRDESSTEALVCERARSRSIAPESHWIGDKRQETALREHKSKEASERTRPGRAGVLAKQQMALGSKVPRPHRGICFRLSCLSYPPGW